MGLFVLCRGCDRHVRAQDERCPFCGEARSESDVSRSARATAVFVSLAIASCAQRSQSAPLSSAPSVDNGDVTVAWIPLDAQPHDVATSTDDAASTTATDIGPDSAPPVPVARGARRRELLSGGALVRDGGLLLPSLLEQPSTAPMYGAPPIEAGDASSSHSPDRQRAWVVLRDLQLAAPSPVDVDLRALALRFRSLQGALAQCASAALRTDPALGGEVTLQLVVEGERVVGETRVASAPTAALGQCFARVVRGARIAPPLARVSFTGRWTVQPQR